MTPEILGRVLTKDDIESHMRWNQEDTVRAIVCDFFKPVFKDDILILTIEKKGNTVFFLATKEDLLKLVEMF